MFWLGLILVPKLVFGLAQQPASSLTILRPDLIPWLIRIDTTVSPDNTKYHFSTTVKNIGTFASGVTKTRLRIDLRSNGSWDYEAFRDTGPKVPGSTESELWASAVTLPNPTGSGIPPYVRGIHLFQICVDAFDTEIELNESNNCHRGVF